MSNYLTANHSIQGGRIGRPQTGTGRGADARFTESPEAIYVEFDYDLLTVYATGADPEVVSEGEFDNRVARMRLMVDAGFAKVLNESQEFVVFASTLSDAEEYKKQHGRYVPACALDVCDDCALDCQRVEEMSYADPNGHGHFE